MLETMAMWWDYKIKKNQTLNYKSFDKKNDPSQLFTLSQHDFSSLKIYVYPTRIE